MVYTAFGTSVQAQQDETSQDVRDVNTVYFEKKLTTAIVPLPGAEKPQRKLTKQFGELSKHAQSKYCRYLMAEAKQ